MNLTTCYLDLDGVITDFVSGVCKLRGKPNPYEADRLRSLGVWETEKLLGISVDEFWRGIGYDFWRNLGFMHDGRKMAEAVMAQFPLTRICLCTAPGGERGSIDGKLDWIAEHFPDLRKRAFVGSAKDVHAHPRALLVDDRDENIDAFKLAGGHTIQVPRTWNRRFAADHVSAAVVRQEIAQLLRS